MSDPRPSFPDPLPAPLARVATPDLNAERLAALKRLLPDLFTAEGRLNPDELRRLAEAQGTADAERYEFKWYGKQRSKRHAFTPSLAALAYDARRSCRPEKAGGNAIIEGENLEVLKLLLPAYRGRVKCILIDPPYNTGKDFVYRDNYARDRQEYWEETGVTEQGVKVDTNTDTSGRFHSDWLSMMHSRLLLARQFLTEDGVIFVHIDENEVCNLRRLMDEVFGEENFVEDFIWKKSYGGGAKERYAVRQHEHCVLYARSLDSLPDLWLPPSDDIEARYYKYRDEHFSTRGPYRIKPLEATKSMDERENLRFPVKAPDGTDIFPKRQWWWSRDRVERVQAENGLVFTKSETGYSVSYKQYLIKEDGEKRGAKPFSIIDKFYTQLGTENIRSIFDDQVLFQFPKPVDLIKHLLAFGAQDDSIVLDFFGGSGTTAQAVLELNATDGGTRSFILVQIPELTEKGDVAWAAGYPRVSDITIDRVRRVIERKPKQVCTEETDQGTLMVAEDQAKYAGESLSSLDAGFRAYRLRPSYFPRCEWAPDPAKTEAENLAALDATLAAKEASLTMQFDADLLLEEVLLKQGFGFARTVERLETEFPKNTVYQVRDGERGALVCLDAQLAPETVDALQKRKPDQRFVCLELALDTTRKWTLTQHLGQLLTAL